jgi:hypothetical protein
VERGRAELAAALPRARWRASGSFSGTEGEDALWKIASDLRRPRAPGDMGAIFDAALAVGDKEGRRGAARRAGAAGPLLPGRAGRRGRARPILVLLRDTPASWSGWRGRRRGSPSWGRCGGRWRRWWRRDEALLAQANAVLAVERMLLEMRPCERGAA